MRKCKKPVLGHSPTAKRKETASETLETYVDWDTFFELILDKENWVEVELGSDDRMDGRLCKSFGHGCIWSDLEEGMIESTFRLFRFESLDNDFCGEFSLCDYCLETGLSEYVEWWLCDMFEEFKVDTLRISISSLGPEAKAQHKQVKQVKNE